VGEDRALMSAARAAAATVRLTPSLFDSMAVGASAAAAAPPFLEGSGLTASLFRFHSGVEAIRLDNAHGAITVLPFQGQQIWDAVMFGRSLKMKSMFPEPRKVELSKQWSYLDTYGAFFVHCGATSMGCPGEADDHPLHGELPNAPYHSAALSVGEDELGEYVEVSGTYHHTAAFSYNLRAEASVRLHRDRSTFPISMSMTNECHSPSDLMYMAHANFLPVEGAELHYTHADGPGDLEISGSINGLVPPSAE